MTPVWGQTEDGDKTTGTDLKVLPRTVIYDPLLSRDLPLNVTAASVANALAHCVEATWTDKANPITDVTAVEGARALREGLLQVLENPTDLDARGNLLYGASLAGSAMASAGTGIHHKLCHLLGGTYNLPHAETHAAVLPQVTRVKAIRRPAGEGEAGDRAGDRRPRRRAVRPVRASRRADEPARARADRGAGRLKQQTGYKTGNLLGG